MWCLGFAGSFVITLKLNPSVNPNKQTSKAFYIRTILMILTALLWRRLHLKIRKWAFPNLPYREVLKISCSEGNVDVGIHFRKVRARFYIHGISL